MALFYYYHKEPARTLNSVKILEERSVGSYRRTGEREIPYGLFQILHRISPDSFKRCRTLDCFVEILAAKTGVSFDEIAAQRAEVYESYPQKPLEELAEDMVQSIERGAKHGLRVELAKDGSLVLYTHGLMEYLQQVRYSEEARIVFKNRFEEPSSEYEAHTRMYAVVADYLRFFMGISFAPDNRGSKIRQALHEVVQQSNPVRVYIRAPEEISSLHVMTSDEVKELDYIEIELNLTN